MLEVWKLVPPFPAPPIKAEGPLYGEALAVA